MLVRSADGVVLAGSASEATFDGLGALGEEFLLAEGCEALLRLLGGIDGCQSEGLLVLPFEFEDGLGLGGGRFLEEEAASLDLELLGGELGAVAGACSVEASRDGKSVGWYGCGHRSLQLEL